MPALLPVAYKFGEPTDDWFSLGQNRLKALYAWRLGDIGGLFFL